jgi:tape measure domain-containing protein
MPDLAELNLVINSSQVTQANNELRVLIQLGGKAEITQRNLANEGNRTNGVMGSLTGSYQKLAAILASVAAGAGAVGFALKAVQLAGKQEQRVIGFTTLLKDGDAAKKMLAELRQFANETPFEFPDLAESAKKMLAFGFAAKDVVPLLREVGDAASSLSGGSELMDSIVRALGQMQGKGRVSMQEMNQLTEAGVNAWKYLADSVGKAKGEIYTIPAIMEKVEKGEVSVTQAMAAFREGMRKDFGGGMAAQSKTLLGLFSNLKDEITTMMTELGQTLVDTFDLKGKVQGAIDFVHKYGAVIGDVIRVLTGMSPKHKEFSNEVKEMVGWITRFKDIAIILGAAIAAIKIGNLVVQVALLAKSLYSATLAASPLLGLILLLAAAVTGWKLGEWANENFKIVQETGNALFHGLLIGWEHVKAGFNLFIEFVNNSWMRTVDLIMKGMALILKAANKLPGVNIPKGDIDSLYAGNAKEIAKSDRKLGWDGKQGSILADRDANIGAIQKQEFIRASEIMQDFGGKDSKGLSFMKKMQDEVISPMAAQISSTIGGLFGITEQQKALNKVIEDGTSTKQKETTVDKQRLNSADIYIQQLKRQETLLGDLNVFARYQDDLKELEIKLNGELTGTEEEKAAAKKKYLGLVKEEIITFERLKVQKSIQEDMIAQQRELAIIQKSYGTDRETLLAVERQIGKEQQSGVTFSDTYINKLKAQNKELIEGRKQAERMDKATQQIGDSIGSAFEDASFGVKSWGEATLGVLKDIEKAIFEMLVTAPLKEAAAGATKGLMSNLGGIFGSFFGGGASTVQAHANGGVVDSPTFFNFNGSQRGLAGERGTELVMPAVRGPNGQLGVKVHGGDKPSQVTNNWNIRTPDADSFRRSRRQIAQDMKRM